MTINKWRQLHDRLARNEITRIRKLCKPMVSEEFLPEIPDKFIDWSIKVRKVVEGKQRSFLDAPFWKAIYQDGFPYKIINGGRQTRKSTYLSDLLAYTATTKPSSQVCYVSFSQQSNVAFSRQKLRVGLFSQNPMLERFLRNKTVSASEIQLKNGSTIYCTHDGNKYRNVEGKSLDLCVLDEAQYQDMQFAQRVTQTMTATKGKLVMASIGGEAGSSYKVEYWDKSDQREWIYSDKDWRDGLQFDENGLIVGEYMQSLLRGEWVPQKSENEMFRSYHIPQTILPTIPLTMKDAVTKYKSHPMYSVEYQQMENPSGIFASHVMAEFYSSAKKPLIEQQVRTLFDRTLGFTSSKDVDHIMPVFLGVDWGGGTSAYTVPWIWQLVNDKVPRFKLLYTTKITEHSTEVQADMIAELMDKYEVDQGVMDSGGGTRQVEKLSKRYAERMFKCTYTPRPGDPFEIVSGETRINVDRTWIIETIIDLITRPEDNPEYQKPIPRIHIPFAQPEKVEWLIDHFTCIEAKTVESGGRSRVIYTHPEETNDDALHACCYAYLAWLVKKGTNWSWVRV